MYVKLTLNIDRDVVVNAKIYARNSHRSISRLVESFLRSITNEEEMSNITLGPMTRKLAGIIQVGRAIDYKDMLTQALVEKHLF
jgi:site-specific recombinase XerC